MTLQKTSLWLYINSEVGRLLISFALTTIIGSVFTYYIQRSNWARQAKIELLKKRYDEGILLLDTLSQLIGKRHFLMQKYLWALSNPDEYNVAQLKDTYFALIAEWNSSYWTTRNKLRLLVGQHYAEQFLTYSDETKRDNPESLHYKFRLAHQKVIDAGRGHVGIAVAQSYINIVNISSSNFLEEITTGFLKRATEASLLRVPPPHLHDIDSKLIIKNLQEQSALSPNDKVA